LKRGFIRALWGIHDRSHRLIERRFRVDENINEILKNKFNEPFRTYVMGEDNYTAIKTLFPDCVMISPNPCMFDLVKYQYRNKLEAIKYAFEQDGYDELVYLDWDCVPKKKLPSSFWDEMSKKEVFQATLQLYHRRKCHWRPEDLRKVPNGGFLYLRDKNLPSLAIEWWEKLGQPDNDEIAWAKIVDERMGGWKGMDVYWEKFEPMFCSLHKSSPYSLDKLKSKDVCFIHYQGGK